MFDIFNNLNNLFKNNDVLAGSKVVYSQMHQFVSVFAQNYIKVWSLKVLTNNIKECEFCDNRFVAECDICGASVCFKHGFFSDEAKAICYECYEKNLVNKNKSKKRTTKKQEQQHQEYQHSYNPHQEQYEQQMYMKCCQVIGCSVNDDLNTIKKKWKIKVAQNHPDRVNTEKEKAKFNKIVVELNQSWDFISKYRGNK